MKLALLKGLNENEKAEFKANFIQASPFRKRLSQVLDDAIKHTYGTMEQEENYGSPNWAALQAGKIERVKTLKTIQGWLENEKT